ncbi:F-box/FBD/LRR-repeat protein-like protein [Tanacetum coccineum]
MDRISKLPNTDRISNIPPSIIETILCLLPFQEAARTSILSRGWRYHWIRIPKLVFIEDMFQVPTDEAELLVQTYGRPSQREGMNKRCKLFYAIYQVLLMHEGPIHEFTLSMTADNSCVEIDHILHHLSKKKTIKKLTLDISWGYKLPLSLFSMHQLTDLYLSSCVLDYQPKFDGFGRLTSLCVQELDATEKSLMHLLSKCPLLKNLGLYSSCSTIAYSDEYDSSIADLFECIPMIENLSIWFHIVLCFVKDRVPKKLPTALVHLKYLFMKTLSFMHKYGLPFLALLIRSSPKLEKLKLEFIDENTWLEEVEIGPIAIEDYSDIWLEHLNELEMINFGNREYELDFVKLILAKSPMLKKVRIFLYKKVDEDEGLKIKEILLRSSRASPAVEIIVQGMETIRAWCFLTLVSEMSNHVSS